MKKVISILLILSLLFVTGFTVIDADYYNYKEPSWSWREFTEEPVYGYRNIGEKVYTAINNIRSKGLEMNDVKVYISPRSYGMVKGMASRKHHEIIIAEDSYNTIYHELGHIYEFKHDGLLEKYERDMKKYYPNLEVESPDFEGWYGRINEDFAEEFRLIFTGGEKRTLYPPFPNFYEWLLRNTQQVDITRKEAFDKLGGTKELIDQGIVIGNTKGDYMLDKTLTRAELATVLVRIKGFNKEKKVPFTDIKNKWYEPYVRKIYNEGLIKGYPDNTFGGNNKITRYELHLILERLNTQK